MVYIWRWGQILVELKLLCFFQLVRFFCQGASDRDLHKLSSVQYEQPRFVTSFPRRAGSKPNIPEWQIRRARAVSVPHLQCFESVGIADLFNFCIQPQTKFLTIQKLIMLRNMLQLQIPPWFQSSAAAEMEKALAPGSEERKGTVLPPPQVTFPGSISLPRSRSSSRWEGEPCYWELLSGSSHSTPVGRVKIWTVQFHRHLLLPLAWIIQQHKHPVSCISSLIHLKTNTKKKKP